MKFGISNFMKRRYEKYPENDITRIGGYETLLSHIEKNWEQRTPGAGRDCLTKVVLVPIPADNLMSSIVTAKYDTIIQTELTTRTGSEGEDAFLDSYANERINEQGSFAKIIPDPATFAQAVLYCRETLQENGGKNSGDYDWEVVAIVTSLIKDQPMDPITMARNYLEKPGGTYAPYTAKQFAEAIYFWSNKVRVGH